MKKEKQEVEYRFYRIPDGQQVLALTGDKWVQHYGNLPTELHFHNYVEIGICHYGDGYVMFKSQKHDYREGNFVIIPPYFPHTTISNEGDISFWEWFYIDISKIIAEMDKSNKNYVYRAKDDRTKVEDIFKDALFLHKDEYPLLAQLLYAMKEECIKKRYRQFEYLQSLLQCIVIDILRICGAVEEKKETIQRSMMIEPALKYMEDHFCDEIKIKQLADACNMSESHFRRIFLKMMNMTPNDYVNLVRIQQACEMLQEKRNGITIKEIAYRVGFANVSTFDRNFKKVMDKTPMQWKNSKHDLKGQTNDFHVSTLKGW